MKKKYEFTGEVKEFDEIILYRIRRIKDGLVGGWIEKEENLSHEGSCFVYDEAVVFGNGKVYGDAKVYNNAEVFGDATVFGYAEVYDYARVCGYTRIYGNAEVYNNAEVRGDAMIYGNAEVYDYATVYGYARIYGNAEVYNYARVYDYARVYGIAKVCGRHAEVFGNAEICDSAMVYGNAKIHEGRIIGQISQSYEGIFQYQCKNRVLTAILTEEGEILYSIGCQENITKEVFLNRIYNESGGLKGNPHREEYLKLIPLIEQYFGN